MTAFADAPITSSDEDLLQRADTAASLAANIRAWDASKGFVGAVTGPWGSGKTSLLNLVREDLQRDPTMTVVDFNPWLFSGTRELIDAFLVELAAQLRFGDERLNKVADAVDAYSELLNPLEGLPFVGAWLGRVRGAAKSLAQAQKKRRASVDQQRERLTRELRERQQPIVVFIDDIDRLDPDEIQQVLKLVRLTGSFPYILYVLAFDAERVVRAIDNAGYDGYNYLDKIVQLSVAVPPVPAHVYRRRLLETIDRALDDVPEGDQGPWQAEAWPDVFEEVVGPLLVNMRDSKRYALSVRAKLQFLKGQVALVDVLALEAVRVALPTVHVLLQQARDALTTPYEFDSVRSYRDPEYKRQIGEIIGAAGSRGEVVKSLIRRSFPAARRHFENNNYGSDWLAAWLRQRRVAHPDVLAAYCEHLPNAGLTAFAFAEEAFNCVQNEEAFAAVFRDVPDERLGEVLAAFEVFEKEYPKGAVPHATKVILQLTSRVPDTGQGLFGIQGRIATGRVILRLLQRLDGPKQVAEAVAAVLPAVQAMSDKLILIDMVGYRDGVGHRLVDEQTAASFQDSFLQELRRVDRAQLLDERDLLKVLLSPRYLVEGEPPITIPVTDVQLFGRALKDATVPVRSQVVGNRAISQSYRLHWEALRDVVGGEDELRRAADELRSAASDETGSETELDLLDRYLSGWRPPD